MGEQPDQRRSCTRKKAYTTEEHAIKVAKQAKEKSGQDIHAYGCVYCGLWHIGRRISG